MCLVKSSPHSQTDTSVTSEHLNTFGLCHLRKDARDMTNLDVIGKETVE